MKIKKVMIMNKIKVGDEILENGNSYIVEADEEGFLWGVSNNAEYEIEIDEAFVPDALFSN